MATVYLSLGTNVGDRWQHLHNAMAALGGLIKIEAVSPVYETAPWGPIQDQPYFLNCCVRGRSDLQPMMILVALKKMERRLGTPLGQRYGPRTIDIDVLSIDNATLCYGRWKLPKPQIERQAFVLVPLRDIAPTWRHPVSGCTVNELIRGVDTTKMRVFGEGACLLGMESSRRPVQMR